MKYIFRITLAAFAVFSLLLTSCKKDDTIRYNNVTMGNFVNGKFISDQGNEFTIVEDLSGTNKDDITRAIMQCDVLKKVEGTENGYEVRVHILSKVLDKKPVEKVAAAEDPENLSKILSPYNSSGFLVVTSTCTYCLRFRPTLRSLRKSTW